METGFYLLLLIAASGYANAEQDSFNNVLSSFYKSGGRQETSQEHVIGIEDKKFACTVKGRTTGIRSICTVKNNPGFGNLQVDVTQDSLIFICHESKYRFTFAADSSRNQICANKFIVASNWERITLWQSANPSNNLSWSATNEGPISNDSEMKRAGSDVVFHSGDKSLQVRKRREGIRLITGSVEKKSQSAHSESDMKKWYAILGINAVFKSSLHIFSVFNAVQIKYEPLKPAKIVLRDVKMTTETTISAKDSTIKCTDRTGRDSTCMHVKLVTSHLEDEPYKLYTLRYGAQKFTLELYADKIVLNWQSYTLILSKPFARVEQSVGDRYAAIEMKPPGGANSEYEETLTVERALSPSISTPDETDYQIPEEVPMLDLGSQEIGGDSKTGDEVTPAAHAETAQGEQDGQETEIVRIEERNVSQKEDLKDSTGFFKKISAQAATAAAALGVASTAVTAITIYRRRMALSTMSTL